MCRHQFSLYARLSLLRGMARLTDFAGLMNTYDISDNPEEADYLAMLADWKAVDMDMRAAFKQFEKEYQEYHLCV